MSDEWVTVEKKKRGPSKPFIPTRTVHESSSVMSVHMKEEPLNASAQVNPYSKKNSGPYDAQRMAQVDASTQANHIDHISLTLANAIIKARNDKKWLQKDLATKSNIPESVIRNWENCKAVYDPITMNKLSQILGVTLKK